ncbi:MAG: hypothetical protein ABH811_01090 [archaeon]
MQKMDLTTAEGILELYDYFNKGGMWIPKQVSLMKDFNGNSLIKCEIPGTFGGPYFDKNKNQWDIPVKINDYAFSWHFLVKELFNKFEIPCIKNDSFYIDETHPENIDEFSKILNEEKGMSFIKAVSDRENAFRGAFNDVRGMTYCSFNKHLKENSAFQRGDSFETVLSLDYFSHLSLEENVKKNFEELEGRKFISSDKIKGFIFQYY